MARGAPLRAELELRSLLELCSFSRARVRPAVVPAVCLIRQAPLLVRPMGAAVTSFTEDDVRKGCRLTARAYAGEIELRLQDEGQLDALWDFLELVLDGRPIRRRTYDIAGQTLSRLTNHAAATRDATRWWEWVSQGTDWYKDPPVELYVEVCRLQVRLLHEIERFYAHVVGMIRHAYLVQNQPPAMLPAAPAADPPVVIDTLCADCRRRPRAWVDSDGRGYCKRCRRPPRGPV